MEGIWGQPRICRRRPTWALGTRWEITLINDADRSRRHGTPCISPFPAPRNQHAACYYELPRLYPTCVTPLFVDANRAYAYDKTPCGPRDADPSSLGEGQRRLSTSRVELGTHTLTRGALWVRSPSASFLPSSRHSQSCRTLHHRCLSMS